MAEMAARVGRKVRKVRYFDYSLVIIILTLVFFGLVMLYSTSAYNGQEKFGDSAYYLKSQGRAVLLGLTAMVLVTAIPYRAWNKIPFLIYGVAFLACLAVPFVGVRLNGQKRWLRFGGITIQPSELAKIAVIIFFAAMLSRMPEQLKSLKNTVKVFFWAVPFIGIVAYSNLSTAIIITGIVVLMMFVASPSYSHYFLALIVVAAAAFAVVWMVKGMEGSGGSYRLERVQVWLDPEKYDKGYPIELRKSYLQHTKEKLAEAAVKEIHENDVVLLDSSTTCLAIAEAILARELNITLVTNSLAICNLFSGANSGVNLVCVGGTFRRRTLSFADPNTVEALRRYYADCAFVSCPKVNVEFGLSDNHISEANMRRQMLCNAQRKILVVDHTKLEGNANILFDGLEKIGLIITDQRLPEEFEAYAAEKKIEVRVCPE